MSSTTAIKKGIKKNKILIFLIPKKEYSKYVTEIAQASYSMLKGICFVSLNKPYQTLSPVFKGKGIKLEKLVFIDAVSTGFKKESGGARVVAVSSPKALTELNIKIRKEIGKVSAIVFDSLSTLLVYEQPSIVIKFSHSVISLLRKSKINGIFIMLKEDMDGELSKDLSMFVDGVVELG
jgi:hypothetical protein